MQGDSLQLEALAEWMYRSISPNHVIFRDSGKKRWPLWGQPSQSVHHIAHVKKRDEPDVYREAWGILYLLRIQSVHLLPVFFGSEINLPDTVSEFSSFENTLQTSKTPTLARTITKHLSANPAGEHFSDNEWCFISNTQFVHLKSCRIIVGGKYDDVGALDLTLQAMPLHQIFFDFQYRNIWVSILEYVFQCINLLATDKSKSANMPNHIFGFHHVFIDQREVFDA